MKITFLGLSCFLLENNEGDKILLDAYNDSPEFSLGLKLPHDIASDLFLVSHPDYDHSYINDKFLKKERKSKEKDDAGAVKFSNLGLRGTIVREWNGDLNIAYHFSLEGIRFLHLADNAHPLNDNQLDEIGRVDIVIMPMPKVKFIGNIETEIENIKKLNPKIVIPSHHIPPSESNSNSGIEDIKNGIRARMMQNWITNPISKDENSIINLTGAYLSALELKKYFPDFEDVWSHEYVVKDLDSNKTKILFFRKCWAD